jgi:hypothetical protein
MSAAYRSSSSANTGSSPAASLLITLPSGIQVNDVLLASISVAGGSSATITTPTGWTLVMTKNEVTNVLMNTYWRLVTGYETTSYAWPFDASRQASGVILAYSGAYGFPPSGYTSNTAVSSTTTATASISATYETGLSIQFFAAYNTTALTTMTAGGSFTQRADTCSTASAFIETVGQDVTEGGMPLGQLPANAATISLAAASVATLIMLEDARPAYNSGLVEDEFVIGSTTSSVTSITSKNINTNFNNVVLLALVAIGKGAATVSSLTASGLTWVNVGRSTAAGGSVELWRTFVPTPQQGITVTMNMSTSVADINYLIVGMVGADITGTNGSGAIGAFSTGSSSSAAPTISITTTRNNSWVWGGFNDPAYSSGLATPAGLTLLRTVSDATTVTRSWFLRSLSITPASGTTVALNMTGPPDSCNTLAVEILPAVTHHMSALGSGT